LNLSNCGSRIGATAFILIAALAAANAPTQPRPTTRPADLDPSGVEQRFIYFPPHRFGDIRILRVDEAILLTNADKPGDDELRQHLTKIIKRLTALPLRKQPTTASRPTTQPKPRPVVAALYADQEQFKALWHRVGVLYGGRFFGVAAAGGYSYRPFCATYVDAKAPGSIPSELSHELAHVWLWRRAGVPNNGNWLSEGLATAIQAKLHTDTDARRQWAERIAVGRYLPLQRLMTDTPVEPHRYWQTCLLAEVLLADHRDALPDVIKAIAAGRSANHIVTKVLETNWLALERSWKAQAAPPPTTKPRSP